MYLRPIDLTTALRPSLLPDETLLCVQDAVGLYRGKSKLPDYQNGHAYLTSHRACYVDNENPRGRCIAVSLKDVDRSELYAGFIKSSPKITLFPKAAKFAPGSTWSTGTATTDSPRLWSTSDQSSFSRTSTPPVHAQNATWICPICSFSNPVPPSFDPSIATEATPLQPCLTCGIKPPFTLVVKAAIAGLSNRQPPAVQADARNGAADSSPSVVGINSNSPRRDFTSRECPRCTFLNHPSLTSCEICGATLSSSSFPQEDSASSGVPSRNESPAPPDLSRDADPNEVVKLSFRAGGEKVFYEQLKGALVQRKWLLQGAPPTPRHDTTTGGGRDGAASRPPPLPKAVGISGLEKRDLELRKNNEAVIGNAFEDLSALMASAKEIIAVAENFAKQTRSHSAEGSEQSGIPQSSSAVSSAASSSTADPVALLSQLNLTTTRDMLGSSSSGTVLYLTQLARQIAEFLTDDRSGVGVLKSAGGIISLVDLWAIFNRARGGVELVSPTDFAQATEQFEKLKLPVRLRRFKKSGLLVVQGADRTDEKTIKALLDWFRELREFPPEDPIQGLRTGWSMWGRGLTALEVAERFGWSVGVATEELEMAEERGALCREIALEGVRFWENWLVVEEAELLRRFGSQLPGNSNNGSSVS